MTTERDAALLSAEGGKFIDAHRHATSAQTLYFEPGTIHESYRLIELFGALGPLPTTAQVRAKRHDIARTAPLYRYRESGDVWYLENSTSPVFERPFERSSWRFFAEGPKGLATAQISEEEALDAFSLMQHLNGTRTVEEVVDMAEVESARSILSALARCGGVEETVFPPLDVETLPELLFLGHSSFAVRDGRTLVVVDPAGLPPAEVLAGVDRPLYQLVAQATAIVISHHHWDHLHFQTLVRLPRDKRFIVPKCTRASISNPSIAAYLRALGFTNVTECAPGEVVAIDGIRLLPMPFFGESFGIGSRFDAFTYVLEFSGMRLYGSVDACHDEAGSMDDVMESIARAGPLDYFFFGSSGQVHEYPCLASAPRYFSNELLARPDLVRYHPDFEDVARWARVLKPRVLVPYAEFLFGGERVADLRYEELPNRAARTLEEAGRRLTRPKHAAWVKDLARLADDLGMPVLMLQTMQGVAAATARPS